MTRGKILYVTREQAVQRALSQIIAIPALPPGNWPSDAGNRPIGYRLDPGFNGGFDPEAPHCASWSYGGRSPTADCIGFVLWASGIDRMQPGYKGSRDEWLNCASLLDDAKGGKKFCRFLVPELDMVKPGDWLMDTGHISMVVRPATRTTKPLVVDCSPRHDTSRQACINLGLPWSTSCKIVRPLIYKSEGV